MADSLLLEPVYDLDTGAEIVDEVTVNLLVRGCPRRVASTTAERIAAIPRMVLRGHGVRAVANNIGISIDDAKQLISQAGFQIVPDPMYRKADGSPGNRTHIVRVGA